MFSNWLPSDLDSAQKFHLESNEKPYICKKTYPSPKIPGLITPERNIVETRDWYQNLREFKTNNFHI